MAAVAKDYCRGFICEGMHLGRTCGAETQFLRESTDENHTSYF